MNNVLSFNKNINPKDRFAFIINKYCSTEIYNFKKVGKGAALCMAIISNQTDVLKKLLDKGISPNLKWEGTAPLFIAIMHNRIKAVQILLENGANPNIKSIIGSTPLHYSSEYISADISRLLLKFGANPRVNDSRGWTPLMTAVQKASLQNLQLFINYIDVSAISNDGETALSVATLNRYKLPRMNVIIEVLLKLGSKYGSFDDYLKISPSSSCNFNNIVNYL